MIVNRNIKRIDFVQPESNHYYAICTLNDNEYACIRSLVFAELASSIRVRGEQISERKARTQFIVHPLQLTEHDVQHCRSDELHVPKPTIGTGQYFRFTLKEGYKIV
jgi:hypothetical protein